MIVKKKSISVSFSENCRLINNNPIRKLTAYISPYQVGAITNQAIWSVKIVIARSLFFLYSFCDFNVLNLLNKSNLLILSMRILIKISGEALSHGK